MGNEKEKNNWLTIIAVLGLAAVALMLGIASVAKDFDKDTKTITVSGSSEKEVMPDMAKVFLKIYTLEKDAKDSQSKNGELSTSVIDALTKLGIQESDIETSSYSVQQRYEWNEKLQKSEIVGYETVNVLKVTTTDIKGLGKIIDTGIQAGANGVDSITFDLKKTTEDALRNELLTTASIAAKTKATSLANALNVKLGDVSSISTSDFNYYPYVYRAMEGKVASDTQILPQKLKVNTQVNVVYEIE